jgi:hypothetical protein
MYFRLRDEKPLTPRELDPEIGGEPIDDPRTPAFLLLAAQDLGADLPVAA